MTSYDDLIKAKTLFSLGETASLSEIKFRYKNLMHQWHPDKHPEDIQTSTQMSAQINSAYKLLLDYCKNFEYPFDEDNIRNKTMTPEEWWHARFGQR
jgi:DnaJ-class molecular chaperone